MNIPREQYATTPAGLDGECMKHYGHIELNCGLCFQEKLAAGEVPNWDRRQDIITHAQKYLGARFVHKGRALTGVDCAGLAYLSYRGAGFNVEDKRDYSNHAGGAIFLEHIASFSTLLENKLDALPGDLVVLRMRKTPAHCGILATGGQWLHMNVSLDKVISEKFHQAWWRRLYGVYRVTELL